MKRKRTGALLQVWISARDTRNWSRKSGAVWPCSTTAGKRIYAEFLSGDLVDLRVDGEYEDSYDGYEMQAILDDFSGGKA